MSQLSLFATRAPPPKPEPPRFRTRAEKHPVKRPYGIPDKRGVYGYQKLWAEIEKMPPMYQEHFEYLTADIPERVREQFLQCLRMFVGFDNRDLMDFDESRGRL